MNQHITEPGFFAATSHQSRTSWNMVTQRNVASNKTTQRYGITPNFELWNKKIHEAISHEYYLLGSRYSDWLRAGRPRVRVRVPVGAKIFSSPCRPDRFWGPPSRWISGALSSAVKRPECKAPTSSEVKKTWIYISTFPYALMAQCLIS
jgi:hypothetical protein